MSAFTGTGALVRLALRRDRVRLPVWLAGVTAAIGATAQSTISLYGTEQALHSYALTSAASIVARAFNGAISGPVIGAVVAAESYFLLALLVPLMNIFLIVRHTRQNEETGRAELIGAASVGRLAGLTAALLVALLADLVLAALLAATLIGVGLPAAGSVALSAAVAGAGVVFAALAAIAAQIAPTARMATGLSVAALGLAFGLRAAGDSFGAVGPDGLSVRSAWPSWASPLGWIAQLRPYSDARWAVLGLFAVLAVAATVLAFVLATRRDVGFGFLPDRRGPAEAGSGLRSGLGLAWRLQRGVLLAWLIGFAVMSVPMGAVTTEVDDMIAGNPQAAELFEALGGAAGLIDAFFGAMTALMALGVTGYALQALLRMRAEEAGGALESLLATAVSRMRWLAGHVLVATVGVVLLLAVSGAGMGLGYALSTGDLGQVGRLTGAAFAYLPAVLVLVGFVVAAFGLVPRLVTGLAWGGLVVCLLLGQIGELLKLPQVLLDLSPFTHVPAVPAAALAVTPLAVLTGVAVALLVAGGLAFRRRNLLLS